MISPRLTLGQRRRGRRRPRARHPGRNHHTQRDNHLERIVNAHVQLNHTGARHHDDEPRGRVRGSGQEHADHVVAGPVLHLSQCAGGLESQRIQPLARILDHQHLVERLAGIAQQHLGKVLRRRVDRADERNPAQDRLAQLHQPPAHQVGGQHAGQQQHGQGQQDAKARDMKAQQVVGSIGWWQQQQRPVHQPDCQVHHEIGDGNRQPDHEARDQPGADSPPGVVLGHRRFSPAAVVQWSCLCPWL